MTTSLVRIRNRFFLSLFVAGWVLFARPVLGIQVEELDAARPWRVEKIEISGNTKFSDSEILRELLTKVRPWYLFWEAEDIFDPITFREDLERIRRFYEAKGYYRARVTYDLTADPESGRLEVKIEVFEGPPVIVSQVNVEISGSSLSPPELPIKQGEIFVEESYRKGEEALRNFFLERGYAHVTTARRAEVNLDQDQARVWYQADPGPLSVFGETTVQGTDRVDPEIVLRELAYQPGEIFSPAKIAESQAKILALDLFGLVRIAPKEIPGKPSIVPMEVEVSEKEAREIRVGVGYGTEDQFRAQLRWQHNNWLGGGRRLSIEAKYSSIFTTGAITLVQPHFFSPRTRGIISLRQERDDEDTYLNNASRFNPRIEHGFTPQLVGFIGYRLEYDRLERISQATIDALGPVRERGLMSGPTLGLVWNTSDGPLNPTKGEVATFTFGQAGKIWGGQYSFLQGYDGGEEIFAARLGNHPRGPAENRLRRTLGPGRKSADFRALLCRRRKERAGIRPEKARPIKRKRRSHWRFKFD